MFAQDAENILGIVSLENEFERVAQDMSLIDPDKEERLKGLVDRMGAHIRAVLKNNPEMGHFLAIAAAEFLQDDSMLRGYLKQAFDTAEMSPDSGERKSEGRGERAPSPRECMRSRMPSSA